MKVSGYGFTLQPKTIRYSTCSGPTNLSYSHINFYTLLIKTAGHATHRKIFVSVPTGKLIDFEVSPPQADTRPETAVPVDSEQTPQSSCSTDSDMEQHRMEPVQEAEPLLASPTLPDTSGDSDSLVTSQKFDFDILLSPPETGNATFVKTPPFVGEEEDEVFFGPVKFSEIVARRAAAEQLEQTKPLASLTEVCSHKSFQFNISK